MNNSRLDESPQDRQNRHEYAFTYYFQRLQADAAEINHTSGFSDTDAQLTEFEVQIKSLGTLEKYLPLFEQFRNARAGLKLALTTGEISEALEAVRKNVGADKHLPEFLAEETEIADVIIRLMNYATDRHLRLAEAIVAKNNYNRTRHDHSKEHRATEHGKRF